MLERLEVNTPELVGPFAVGEAGPLFNDDCNYVDVSQTEHMYPVDV